MERLPEHVKGLLITATGVLILTPDTLLVRLIATDQWTMVFWRGILLMIALAADHPGYGWERNKGYGTAEHLDALRVHGPCPVHRHSFAPVEEAARLVASRTRS